MQILKCKERFRIIGVWYRTFVALSDVACCQCLKNYCFSTFLQRGKYIVRGGRRSTVVSKSSLGGLYVRVWGLYDCAGWA